MRCLPSLNVRSLKKDPCLYAVNYMNNKEKKSHVSNGNVLHVILLIMFL